MAGTKIGGKRVAERIKERYGVDESGKSVHYSTIGRIGGRAKSQSFDPVYGGEVKKIVGHEDYSVTSNGLILAKNGMPKKPMLDGKGYHRVQLYDKTKHNNVVTVKVHRVVAQHFVDNPNNLPQVDHIDCDKTNNSADNLEWVTNEENHRRAVANGIYDRPTPQPIVDHGAKALAAISDGYIQKDVLNYYGIDRKSFWRWIEKSGITPSSYEPHSSWRKIKYYYFDKSRKKWRVERSNYIPTGKQFDTEDEAREYASQSVGGGFFANPERARLAGAKGGRHSMKHHKLIRIENNQLVYLDKSGNEVRKWAR